MMKKKAHRKRKQPGFTWRAAQRAGIDVSLIEANLRLSVAERVRRHALALNQALELRAAMERKRGRS